MSQIVSISEQIGAVLDVAGPSDVRLQAVVRTLRLFERFEPEARAFFTGCIEEDKKRREIEDHPAVQVVKSAFPGAEINYAGDK